MTDSILYRLTPLFSRDSGGRASLLETVQVNIFYQDCLSAFSRHESPDGERVFGFRKQLSNHQERSLGTPFTGFPWVDRGRRPPARAVSVTTDSISLSFELKLPSDTR